MARVNLNARDRNAPQDREQKTRRRVPWTFLGILNLIVFVIVLLVGLRVFVLPHTFPRAAEIIPLPESFITASTSVPTSTTEEDAWISDAPVSEAGALALSSITPAPTLPDARSTAPAAPGRITPAPTLAEPLAPPSATLAPTTRPFTPQPGESGQYLPQPGSPFYIRAAAQSEEESACDSVSIAGQVFTADGTPLRDVTVTVSGFLGEQKINASAVTGTALLYGPAGYEIQIGSRALRTEKTLFVQVMDEEDRPLSPRIFFNTYETCEKNLAIVNFIQSSDR